MVGFAACADEAGQPQASLAELMSTLYVPTNDWVKA